MRSRSLKPCETAQGYQDPRVSERAACRGLDIELVFPDTSEATSASEVNRILRQAEEIVKQACVVCPEKENCLEFALTNNETGVWGGTNDKERKTIKRTRAKQAK